MIAQMPWWGWIIIVVLALLWTASRHGNTPFWRAVAKYPEIAIMWMAQDNAVWELGDLKPGPRFNGPFRLNIPGLGFVKAWGRADSIEESQEGFMRFLNRVSDQQRIELAREFGSRIKVVRAAPGGSIRFSKDVLLDAAAAVLPMGSGREAEAGVTDWHAADELNSECPGTFRALQDLVVALDDSLSVEAASWAPTVHGTAFGAALRATLVAMMDDGLIHRTDSADRMRFQLLKMIDAFAKAFPNWQDVYSIAVRYLSKEAERAENDIRELLKT